MSYRRFVVIEVHDVDKLNRAGEYYVFISRYGDDREDRWRQIRRRMKMEKVGAVNINGNIERFNPGHSDFGEQ